MRLARHKRSHFEVVTCADCSACEQIQIASQHRYFLIAVNLKLSVFAARSSAYDRKRRFNVAADRAFVNDTDVRSAKESRVTSNSLMTSSAPCDVTGDVTSTWHGVQMAAGGMESSMPLPGPGMMWQTVASVRQTDAAAGDQAPSS